ncbi:MAG: hypothetical protein N2423_00920 [Novosphingobium sp.]|nr:hypothetical protein [Novosphingobium sp.]
MLEPVAPGLLIERCGFNRQSCLIEFTTPLYHGGACDFCAELSE